MKYHYSSEKSIQILISLLKQHNIKKLVVSPGATNLSFVASVQQDSWFEIYSSVDERSAAYIACGMAAESGEPVALSCTGATASRNYMPGLTEAYYRKLPVLAITSTQDISRIGHLRAQVIDRRSLPNDIALLSEHIPATRDENDVWSNTIKINRALLELRHHGGGPVHLNLTTTYSPDYSVEELPVAQVIHRIGPADAFPALPKGRIAIFIGAHAPLSTDETAAIDRFCAAHNAVVFCDHTSSYKGKYRVLFSLVARQDLYMSSQLPLRLLIHIGEISGDYQGSSWPQLECVWRVSPDGELRDTFRRLDHVFEMPESLFFDHYATDGTGDDSYLTACREEYDRFLQAIPELPFSNAWIAQQSAHRFPQGAVVHLGILNSLRSWNTFEFPSSVTTNCNVGGFGIDGILSSLIGASFVRPDTCCFVVLGDLAFFYDMNVLGNRHLRSNIRILLINNGKGTEFRNYDHPGAIFGDDADPYIAAAGHYGNKSKHLVKHYAEDLGFEYLTASSKEEYLQQCDRFFTAEMTEKPLLFEVFTNSQDETEALYAIKHIEKSLKKQVLHLGKQLLGKKVSEKIKSYLGKH